MEKTIYLGGGCFWCVEAVFKRIPGVRKVQSGYMGGKVPNPSYEMVCQGNTGHVEVVKVDYDPALLPLESLLDYFWRAHDPTTLNRQGADVGEQYRSVIFYLDPAEKKQLEASKKLAQKQFHDPIVTTLEPAPEFFKAESYHDDYFQKNPNNPYCRFNIPPKLEKLKLPLNEL